MARMTRETELSAPICAWLHSRGLTVYCEVPIHGTCVDVMAYGPPLVAVELKLSLTRKVIKQAILDQVFADESWCAVPTRPRSLEEPKRFGVGVLAVHDQVEVLCEPDSVRVGMPFPASRAQVIDTLSKTEPGGVGGKPSPINDGPAQQVARLVAPLYQAGLSWVEIYKRVPNHYANPRSLAGVMRGYGPARVIIGERDHKQACFTVQACDSDHGVDAERVRCEHEALLDDRRF
jgi:hypothetical protein